MLQDVDGLVCLDVKKLDCLNVEGVAYVGTEGLGLPGPLSSRVLAGWRGIRRVMSVALPSES